ncbi:MAG: SDR family oxidoreductase [Chloroflexi bacterium]|nr:MAG: SDR family oxidoreductase [Chloroflexota bacterium]
MDTSKQIVLITGAKIVAAKRRFDDRQDVTYLHYKDTIYKMNSAAGVAFVLAKNGYAVYVQVTSDLTAEVLAGLDIVPEDRCFRQDLTDARQADELVSIIATAQQQSGLDVALVHYGSASEAAGGLPDASLGVDVWDTPASEVHSLINANIVTLYHMMQSCQRFCIFERQQKTKAILISAIAAVRPRVGFGLDNIQKAAGHALSRTLALELAKDDIHITELLVGSLDGGYYDNDATLAHSIESSKGLGYEYQMDTKPVFSAEQVGEAALYALEARCNVRQMTIAPFGQYPQMGA